ncbi:MAG: peptidoglycan DD-metalloendopeptidase family protein [Gammaproteobacteria bacterium]|nr:peptidoglycan DD-metalloendopeptidase family protein [Gammaproteobacteria bacterium]
MPEATGPARRRPHPVKWLVIAALASAAAVTLFLTLFHDAGSTITTEAPKIAGTIVSRDLALPVPIAVPAEAAPAIVSEPVSKRIDFEIASGDTLHQLFAASKLNRSHLAQILQLDQARTHLQLLRPGDRLSVVHDDGDIVHLQRVLDEERTMEVTRNGDGFDLKVTTNPVEVRTAHAHGVIDSSLYLAAQEAGISDTLIMNLAGIFAWDVDFVLDIRTGDRFTMIYEEIWQDGEKLRDGDILAAEFINSGKTFRAIRFENPEKEVGYFTPDGLNVKKAFLRAPIAINPRVTSSFNPRRKHPVHNKVLPHKGVDYSAPTGTAIKAAGDGKVIFRGRKGGYGNTIILQHGGNITTLYAHLSKFHSRARSGKRVKQGQLIGYSGATGTVTAAHLHYEYRVGGVHRNPRTVRLPKAQPIAKKYRNLYVKAAAPLLQQLELVERTLRVATSQPAHQ